MEVRHFLSRKYCVFTLFFLLFSSHCLQAAERFSLDTPKLGFNDGDFIVTLGSNNLPTMGWRLSTGVMYGYRPLEITSSGVVVGRVIDQLLIQHFDAAFSPASWWEIEADLPVVWLNQFREPTVPLPDASSNQLDLSDLQIRQRFTFSRRDQHAIGVALVPYVNVPIGNEDHFVGDDQVTGGATLSFDGNPGKRVSLGLNVGFKAQKRVFFFDLDEESLLTLSGGVAVRLSDRLSLKGDIYTSTPFNDLFRNKDNTPTEILLATNYRVGETGFRFDVGGGLSLIRAAGVPLFRALATLSYVGQFSNKPQPSPASTTSRPVSEVKPRVVYFEYDSATLTENSKKVLDEVLQMIHGEENLELVILTGHTDSRGSEEYNLDLSRERAESVADYLISHDIKKTKIKIQAFGEEQPIASNETQEGMSLNRRVEIQIIN